MTRLSLFVFAAMVALLLAGALATRADGMVRDPGKRHYYAGAPRDLGWYWWPEVGR